MLYQKTLDAIKNHAESEYPKECCGLLIAIGKKEVYRPCRNLASSQDHFRMSPEDWSYAEDDGTILAVVHSHPDSPSSASEADLVSCEQTGLPWIIVSVRDGVMQDVNQFSPSGWSAPLLGRPFFHGSLDCYTLVKDWYLREVGIALIDGERENDWWKKGQDLYMDRYESAGFKKIPDGGSVQYGDLILMSVHAPVANHAGIYLGDRVLSEGAPLHPVPNSMIHHLYGRLSERVVYGGYWADVTRAVVRHKDLK